MTSSGARLALQCQVAAAVPALLTDTEVLDIVEGTEHLLRWATGLRIRMLAEFTDRHPTGSSAPRPGADPPSLAPVDRWLPDEIGMALELSRLEALSQLSLARRLAHVLPDTLGLLELGRICPRRAEALAHATAVLPDDKARQVEARVLPKAADSTPRQHRDRIRRAVARVDPDGEHRRHKEATKERRVSIRPLEDGMASLWLYGGAEHVEPSWQMLDRLARSLGPQDPRTLDERRFVLAMQILQGRLTVTDQSDIHTAVTDHLTTDTDSAGTGDADDTATASTVIGTGSEAGIEPGANTETDRETGTEADADTEANIQTSSQTGTRDRHRRGGRSATTRPAITHRPSHPR